MSNLTCPMCGCVHTEEGKVITAGKKPAPARDTGLRQQIADLKSENKELLGALRELRAEIKAGKPAKKDEGEEDSGWD